MEEKPWMRWFDLRKENGKVVEVGEYLGERSARTSIDPLWPRVALPGGAPLDLSLKQALVVGGTT